MTGGTLLFAGESYYPQGGWSDLVGTYGTVDEAKAVIDSTRREVTIPAQPARRVPHTAMISTTLTLLTTSDGFHDFPAVPERIEARYAYDWAHVVVDGKIVTEWSSWPEAQWSAPA